MNPVGAAWFATIQTMNWFTPDKVGEVPQSMIITPLYIQNKDFILEHFAIHFAILMLSTEVSGIQLCPFRAVSVFVSTFRSPHVLLRNVYVILQAISSSFGRIKQTTYERRVSSRGDNRLRPESSTPLSMSRRGHLAQQRRMVKSRTLMTSAGPWLCLRRYKVLARQKQASLWSQ